MENEIKKDEVKMETPAEVKVEVPAVETPKVEVPKVEPKKVMKPKFFVSSEEKIKVEIDVLFDKDDGSILSIFLTEENMNSQRLTELLGLQRLTFVFSKPSYDKVNRYRTRCSEYNPDTKGMMVNQLKMRDFFIIYHLKEWNVEDENGNKMDLKFDPNGALSDASLSAVYNLHPSILDIVLNQYERMLLM